MPRTNRRIYAIAAALLLAIEIAIALFSRGGFIRHTLGDFLAVLFAYCTLMATMRLSPAKGAIAAFLVAAVIETAQAFGLGEAPMINSSAIGRTVFGSTFDWGDIAAYAAGAIAALVSEKARACRRPAAR